ncbi:oxidoreductase [Amycolatopsis coloradensis]
MFERAEVTARMSARVHELLTAPDAARKMLAFFQPD